MLRHLPNLLTVARLLLVVPVVFAIARDHYPLALTLFIIAGFTDALDGLLARKFGWQSEIGSVLDPVADKVMMVAAFASLALRDQIALWLFLAVLFRDIVIVSGSAVYHMRTKSLQMHPTLIGKLNTLLQVILIVLVLLKGSGFAIAQPVITVVVAALLVTTIGSGIHYVRLGFEKVSEYVTD